MLGKWVEYVLRTCVVTQLVAAPATVERRPTFQQIDDGDRALYVCCRGSTVGPLTVMNSPVWLDGEGVVRLEWRYAKSAPIVPVLARVGARIWSFRLDEEHHRATVVVDKGIRLAWNDLGVLTVSCKTAGKINLHWRPQELALGADGVTFSVEQRSSASVPGSRGWIRVSLDDITKDQVHLGLCTAEGEAVAPLCSVREGDEVVFRVGHGVYVVRVKRLNNLLLGHDYAELCVARQEVAAARVEGENSQESAEEPHVGATERPGPARSSVLDKVSALLYQAGQEIDRAENDAGAGDYSAARAALHLARERQEDVRHELTWRPQEGLKIGSNGAAFSVQARARDSMPGSRGWLQVFVYDVRRPRTGLEIRTFDGALLVRAPSLTEGQGVAFTFGDVGYVLLVERVVRDVLPIPHDYVHLRVIRRKRPTENTGAHTGPSQAKVPAETGSSKGRQPVEATLIDLVDAALTQAQQNVESGLDFASRTDLTMLRVACRAARERHKAAKEALGLIANLRSRLRTFCSVIEDLSVLKVRILGARAITEDTAPPRLAPNGGLGGSCARPREPHDLSLIERVANIVFGSLGRSLGFQKIDARIVETKTIGREYASQTIRGREFADRRREDLGRGDRIELLNSLLDTGVKPLEEGRLYWIAITPNIASKAIPREIGAQGRSTIVFCMPVPNH